MVAALGVGVARRKQRRDRGGSQGGRLKTRQEESAGGDERIRLTGLAVRSFFLEPAILAGRRTRARRWQFF